jgi:hypothetical protein
MNNKRLDKFSDKFEADTGETIEKRCFFLFAGKDLNQGSAFSLDLTFTKSDDPKASQFIKVDINVDYLTMEQCSDVIVSLTNIVPDFRIVFRYDDIFPKPESVNIEKKVRY